MLRKLLRWAAGAIFLGLGGAVLSGVVGQFFVKAAEEKGYYDNASGRLDAAMTAFSDFVLQTWFLCLASASAGLAIGLWADALLRTRERRADAATALPVPVQQSLYVGRIGINTNRLVSDYLLEFAIFAFNGSSQGLHAQPIRGRVCFGPSPATPASELVPLPEPIIKDDTPAQIAPGAEFLLVVSQPVPGAMAAEIDQRLTAGERLLFSFTSTQIELRADTQEAAIRLPVWNGVTLERDGRLAVTHRLATVHVHDRLTSGDGQS